MDFVGLQDKANYRLSSCRADCAKGSPSRRRSWTVQKLLMLDEPLANLDLASQRATVHVLAKLNRELGMTIQVVAHDLDMCLVPDDLSMTKALRLPSAMRCGFPSATCFMLGSVQVLLRGKSSFVAAL